jgi:hypothetical protein
MGLSMNEHLPTGRNRKLIRNVTAVLVGVFVAYLLLFAIAVRKGNAIYELDSPETRGGFQFYWFSDEPVLNRAGCRLFQPVFRILLKSRPYSSFQTEQDRISWCEQGNNIVMDDLAAVGIHNE